MGDEQAWQGWEEGLPGARGDFWGDGYNDGLDLLGV